MRKLLNRLFKKVSVDTTAKTIPEAFGFPEEKYAMLINEMVNHIKEEDRLLSFAEYLETPYFKKYNLDLSDPNTALLVGYAFCSAIMLQRNIQMQHVASQVLEAFYPNGNAPKKQAN